MLQPLFEMDDSLLARAHDAADIGHSHPAGSLVYSMAFKPSILLSYSQQYHHAGSLYIAAIIMETFLPNDDLVQPLFGVLEQFVHSALSLFTSVSLA